jgi:hypothetical protein
VDPKTGKKVGAFLGMLNEAQAKARQLATRFLIHDPRTYFKATRENDMQDLYNSAGKGGDPWYVLPLMVGLAIVGIVVFVILGFLMVKVAPAISPKPAAGAFLQLLLGSLWS